MKKLFNGLLLATIVSHVGLAFWARAAQAANDRGFRYTCTTKWDDSLPSFTLELTPFSLRAPDGFHHAIIVDHLGNRYTGSGIVSPIEENTRLTGMNDYAIHVSSPEQTAIRLSLAGDHSHVFGHGSILRPDSNQETHIYFY